MGKVFLFLPQPDRLWGRMTQVPGDITSSGLVTLTNVSTGLNAFILKSSTPKTVLHCLTLKMKARRSFEAKATIYRSSRWKIAYNLDLQEH
jgi:hypothetical protein